MFTKVVVFAAVVTCALAAAADADVPPKTYTSEFDNFDIDAFASDKQKIGALKDCLFGTAPCTPFGQHFKDVFPDAYNTQCAKCDPKQRILGKKTILAFKKFYPQEFDSLIKKIDPELKNWDKFEKAVLV